VFCAASLMGTIGRTQERAIANSRPEHMIFTALKLYNLGY